MGLAVWRPLQRHPQMVSAIKAVLGSRAAVSGQVNQDEVAALFGLKQVLVGKQRTNTCEPGPDRELFAHLGQEPRRHPHRGRAAVHRLAVSRHRADRLRQHHERRPGLRRLPHHPTRR